MKLIWIAKHKPRVELVEMKCDRARIRGEMQTVEYSKNVALRRRTAHFAREYLIDLYIYLGTYPRRLYNFIY